jgi:cryptochrome
MKRPIDMKAIMGIVQRETGTSSVPGGSHALKIPAAKDAPNKIPPLFPGKIPSKAELDAKYRVPDIHELYTGSEDKAVLKNFGAMRFEQFPGGERAALARLKKEVSNQVDYVCKFEKPKTSSTNGGNGSSKQIDWTKPSTTGLSPYVTMGCLSVHKLWHAINACYKKKKHAQPPQSLHGQLLFRELFYVLSHTVPNWDRADNNIMCKPVKWDSKNTKLLEAWKRGQTGYPFIDALMRQLNQTGWMHHLGRHAVSCFLTRGDLYQHWVFGRDVFDKLLLDADWALNNGNWMWLAGVAPFSMPFFRVYNPSPIGDTAVNAEQTGEFIKFFVPELRKMPVKHIYKPWEAPLDVQKAASCTIGKDYPKPIVDHQKASQKNISSFSKSLAAIRKSTPAKAVKRSASSQPQTGGWPATKRRRTA